MESVKKIMLFGGSYNPIHRGHLNAALNASSYLHCDEVWLIPRKYNYDGSLLLSGKHRVNMIQMAIKNLPNFKICDIELKDQKKELIYTYNTAVRLKKKYKDVQFYFLIGADQLNNLNRWYEAKKLTEMFQFVCFQRPGYILNSKIAEKYHVMIIEGEQVDASSTNVRMGMFSKIDEDIQQYIIENQLYLKERVMPRLPESRFIHVLTTARLAKKIAAAIGENTNRAYVAGILHDIAKGLTHDEVYYIVKEHYPQYLHYPKYALHAYASEYIAQEEFGIHDKKILKAIRLHARPEKNMSRLDKIIYCSDKLEESRPFADSLNKIREMAFHDIDRCFIMTMENQLQYLIQSHSEIDSNIQKMIEYYTIKGEKACKKN